MASTTDQSGGGFASFLADMAEDEATTNATTPSGSSSSASQVTPQRTRDKELVKQISVTEVTVASTVAGTPDITLAVIVTNLLNTDHNTGKLENIAGLIENKGFMFPNLLQTRLTDLEKTKGTSKINGVLAAALPMKSDSKETILQDVEKALGERVPRTHSVPNKAVQQLVVSCFRYLNTGKTLDDLEQQGTLLASKIYN